MNERIFSLPNECNKKKKNNNQVLAKYKPIAIKLKRNYVYSISYECNG